MTEEYKRSCQDEIDWNTVQQLHESILQMSKSCFEYKKICVGLIGAALAVLVKLTENAVDHSYFVVTLLICIGFWLADSTAYYYQRSNRRLMNSKINQIEGRNGIGTSDQVPLEVIWYKAPFNPSMVLYYFLATCILLAWVGYYKGLIGT